jgi:hypothetical protein
MVGLERFQAHFAAFTDQYVLIGGTATQLVLDEQGLEARATKDLDIVLCVEALSPEFVAAFWAFIRLGGYQNQQLSTGRKIFYRFSKPAAEDFPAMLEIFSRQPDGVTLGEGAHLTPIPLEDYVSSLSAILLDGDYYAFLHAHKRELGGVPVVDEYCLIPLKARAWLDLSKRKDSGEAVDQRNIHKHRNDILRLFQLLRPEQRVGLPPSIEADMVEFLEYLGTENDTLLRSIGIQGVLMAQVIDTMRQVFGTAPGQA